MAFYRRLSIRSQLSFIAVCIAAVMLFIISITYIQMSGIISSNNEQYTKDMIAQIKQTVHSNKDVIDRLMTNIAYNNDVQNYLTEPEIAQIYMYSKRISSLFINMRTLKEGILDIVLHGEDGRWYDLYGGKKWTGPFAPMLAPKDAIHYFGLQNFGDAYQSENCILVGMKIKSFQSGDRFNSVIGTLFFVIDPTALIGESGSIAEQLATQSFLVDRENKIISSSNPEEVGSELDVIIAEDTSPGESRKIIVNGQTYAVQTEDLPEISSMIVSMIPVAELLRDISKIRKLELAVFIFGAIIMFALFMLVINNVLLPLKKLMAFISSIKRGDLNKLKNRIHLQGYAEITVMSNELNSMLDEVDNLTHQLLETNAMLYETELEKNKSELSFLRSQINPHFLYNTLEMVKGMAAVKGANEIREIAKALGQIFRYSIKGGDRVALQTEMGIIESYMYIQQIRFGDRFRVRYELTDEAMACQIPKMILQPIVENAVFHGLETKEEQGTLVISGKVNEQKELVIAVEDDGLGITPERLEQIRNVLTQRRQAIQDREDAQVSSIGLANVNNRIKLTFGDMYGLYIDSTLGEGTIIQLVMPARGTLHV
ncbi:cache domain-containing sensor histidine kinase [Paenibacillus spongiae]|uniref:histidine kinase n=1 Tax=Paenibacillus spongiae TaxID=2909671 RepID=A0ABY5S907_9BACL|nr:sensor histidine kinase [Paenibacillus spongiae]UVI30164.1 sensor histidine kinase [Paenibacillus spongiae]